MPVTARRLVTTAAAAVLTVGLAGLAAVDAGAAPPTAVSRVHAEGSSTGSAYHNPRLKEVLSQDDADRNAEAPVAAYCQKFLPSTNPYRAPAPDVDMISGDTVVPAGSQTGCDAAQNETTIAVNPADPDNLVAGTNDYRVFNTRENRNDGSGWAYTTMDGGKTWANVQLPHLTFQTGATGALSAMDSAGDPVIAFGKDNTVFYGNIVFSRGAPGAGSTEAPNGLVVSVSHDGGLTWGEPSVVRLDGVDAQGNATPTHVFNDKIWLAVDKSTNQVYVTWTRFLDDKNGGYVESPIVMSTSKDGGQTFSKFRRLQPVAGTNAPGLQPYSQGSNPVVAPDGTLYVAFESEYCATAACDRPRDHDVTVVATSHDHGATFTTATVGPNYDTPATLTGENFRLNSYPQLTVDPVTSRLAIVWNDDRNGQYDASTGASVRTNVDNIVSTSTNGTHWTTPVAVGSAQDEIFGAVAAYGGTVAVSSYTRAYQPGKSVIDFAYWPITAPAHAPVTAGRMVRVTTQSSDPRVQFVGLDDDGSVLQGVFIGDYTGVAMGSDKVLHPAWTDFRGNPGTTTPNQDAYTRAIPLG